MLISRREVSNIKRPIAERENLIKAYIIEDKLSKERTAELLGCSTRTVEVYAKSYLKDGVKGLIDHRRSNNFRLTKAQKQIIIDLKTKDRWRSARNIRDYLKLRVHRKTVWEILKQAGLNRENLKRVKAIKRFEARHPNQMWQTDIMGKITFSKLGDLYLVAALDDYSRFVLAGKWFKTQGKMNVFNIWYDSLSRYGLPEKMLQDEGSQYKAKLRFGQADYEWYAKQLKIELIWAPRPQVKGKIERFWKFVQSDFVPEVIKAKTLEEVNGKFKLWLAAYNFKFRSEYFDHKTRAERYRSSKRKIKRVELETLLLVEERRKVTRESTISIYGKHYFVPPGYIGCRIWVKIVGNRVCFEANGKIFWKTRLRLS
jgi:transposase InsO family protein